MGSATVDVQTVCVLLGCWWIAESLGRVKLVRYGRVDTQHSSLCQEMWGEVAGSVFSEAARESVVGVVVTGKGLE
ncbi:hypothetical protein GQ44DRAFT_24934 [Phaeosphaeriaceae sp. PMI808]|nr:hypothetical protein GQ44DRAFT_24934 [Phaeosphaeriaceae sp. PMI808]